MCCRQCSRCNMTGALRQFATASAASWRHSNTTEIKVGQSPVTAGWRSNHRRPLQGRPPVPATPQLLAQLDSAADWHLRQPRWRCSRCSTTGCCSCCRLRLRTLKIALRPAWPVLTAPWRRRCCGSQMEAAGPVANDKCKVRTYKCRRLQHLHCCFRVHQLLRASARSTGQSSLRTGSVFDWLVPTLLVYHRCNKSV